MANGGKTSRDGKTTLSIEEVGRLMLHTQIRYGDVVIRVEGACEVDLGGQAWTRED